MSSDVDMKTGDVMSEILESKHPVGKYIKISSLPIFESCLELINIEATEGSVEKVAKILFGSTDPSGIDSMYMSRRPLKVGGTSTNLHRSIEKLVEWLTNNYLPWIAYRVMTWCRLVGLNKCLRV